MRIPSIRGSSADNRPAQSSRRSRLVWLLAGAGLLALAVSGFIVFDLHQSQQLARRSYADSVRGLELIGELQYHAQEARRTLLYALATTDSNRQVEYADQSRAADARVARLLEEDRALANSAIEVKATTRLIGSWAVYLKIRDELIALMLEGNPKQAIERDLGEGVPAFNRVRDDLQGIQRLCKSQAGRLLSHANESFQNSLLRLIVMLVLTLLLASVVVVTIQKTTRLRTVQASEARLRQDLESISEELILLDPQGRVLLWNQAAETAWKRSRTAVVGRPLLEVFPEIVSTPLPAAIAAALEKGLASLHSDLRLADCDGERRYEARVFSFQGGASVFLHDITSRKQAEASQTRLTAILEATPDFVGIANAHGGVLYINRAGRQMTGHAENEDITPLKIADFSPEWATKIILEQGLPIAARDGLWAGETAFRGPDGQDVRVSQVILAHRDVGDEVMSFSTVARDITAQKKAQAEFENLNQRLIEASRLAGMAEVATGVLHNVGNVLNSVNVSANIITKLVRQSKVPTLAQAVQLLHLRKDDLGHFLTQDPKGTQLPRFLAALSEHLTREQANLAEEVGCLQKNIEHIKQVVTMQQSYAKVSGVQEILSVQELVEDALRINSSALVRHRVEIVRQFEVMPPVLIDRHKVLQILVNLISNAKQALDKRATGRLITLRVRRHENQCVRVEVIDNGMGIPLENLMRIFHHGFTTKKTGHGFGLHSCANAAKEMGGSLNVQSDGLGQGATFILELPASEGVGRVPQPSTCPQPLDQAAA